MVREDLSTENASSARGFNQAVAEGGVFHPRGQHEQQGKIKICAANLQRGVHLQSLPKNLLQHQAIAILRTNSSFPSTPLPEVVPGSEDFYEGRHIVGGIKSHFSEAKRVNGGGSVIYGYGGFHCV